MMKEPEKTLKFRSQGPQLVRNRLKGKIFLVPTFVTVIGIFCGFMSILYCFQGQLELACKFIGFAFVLDGLDGRIARRLNATSAFGREFDSLSDLVAFGVAPAVLIYTWAFKGPADEFGMLVAFTLVVCGATRLARFNIDTEHRPHFLGLPIPGAAAALASLVFFYPEPIQTQTVASFIMLLTATLAGLMVSTVPFPSLKHLRVNDVPPRILLLIVSIAVAMAWYHNRLAMLIASSIYAFSGPVLMLVKRTAPTAIEKVKTVIR